MIKNIIVLIALLIIDADNDCTGEIPNTKAERTETASAKPKFPGVIETRPASEEIVTKNKA